MINRFLPKFACIPHRLPAMLMYDRDAVVVTVYGVTLDFSIAGTLLNVNYNCFMKFINDMNS